MPESKVNKATTESEFEELEFIGTKIAAERWKVKPSTVTKWCRVGKIQGAEQDAKGSPWRIPKDAIRP